MLQKPKKLTWKSKENPKESGGLRWRTIPPVKVDSLSFITHSLYLVHFPLSPFCFLTWPMIGVKELLGYESSILQQGYVRTGGRLKQCQSRWRNQQVFCWVKNPTLYNFSFHFSIVLSATYKSWAGVFYIFVVLNLEVY